MKQPLVSVFVCTYNQEKYIAQTLDSFLMQQCDFDFEIIIGEDCSKDRTLEICQNYVAKFPDKIILLSRKKNMGIVKNYFDGLSQCKGKYIASCGGDDYWTDPLKLSKQVDFLEKNPETVINYHDSIMVDEFDALISDTEVGYENRRDFSSDELQRGAFISARTICFRNVLDFSKINYKKVFNEDNFLYAILGEYGNGKYCHDIESAVYRILKQGIWSSRNEIQRIKAFMITNKCLYKYFYSRGNLILSDYYYYKYFLFNSRILFLSSQSKNTKDFFKAYFCSLFDKKSIFKDSNFLVLQKTLLKYIINQINLFV